MTTHLSIHYWRPRYAELLPFMRESGVTPEEADDDECIRLLAEWNGARGRYWVDEILAGGLGHLSLDLSTVSSPASHAIPNMDSKLDT